METFIVGRIKICIKQKDKLSSLKHLGFGAVVGAMAFPVTHWFLADGLALGLLNISRRKIMSNHTCEKKKSELM